MLPSFSSLPIFFLFSSCGWLRRRRESGQVSRREASSCCSSAGLRTSGVQLETKARKRGFSVRPSVRPSVSPQYVDQASAATRFPRERTRGRRRANKSRQQGQRTRLFSGYFPAAERGARKEWEEREKAFARRPPSLGSFSNPVPPPSSPPMKREPTFLEDTGRSTFSFLASPLLFCCARPRLSSTHSHTYERGDTTRAG